jgi:hypothetical protein
MNNATTGLSKTPAATISHCAQSETLPMARSMPHYLGHISLRTVYKPLPRIGVSLVQTERARPPSHRRN